jgi:hypothetical protein
MRAKFSRGLLSKPLFCRRKREELSASARAIQSVAPSLGIEVNQLRRFPMEQTVRINTIKVRRIAIEAATLSAIVATSGLLIIHLSSLFPDSIYDVRNFWFNADPDRVLRDLTSGVHRRTSVHPIFPILLGAPTRLLIFFGFALITAAKIILVIAGVFSAVFLYLASRSIGIRLQDSILLHLAFMSSASFLFWFGLIETFPLSAPMTSFMIWIACVKPRTWVWILGSAATLSVTTTNWSLGLFASYFGTNRVRFILINVCAFVMVVFLALVQKRLMPSSDLFFLPGSVGRESVWVHYDRTMAEAVKRILHIWLFTGVTPPTALLSSVITNINSNLASFTYAGAVALISWIIMLGSGMFGIYKNIHLRNVSLAVLWFLCFQTTLHVIYGDEPFLYSVNFLPGMIILCAFGFLTPAARVCRAAFYIFVTVGSFSNYSTLQYSIQLLHRALTIVLHQ